jgi:hypothetical protein
VNITKPKYEIADLFISHGHLLKNITSHQQKVIGHITACRTEKMGAHILKCDNVECGHDEQAYNSCRDRNCPKCQYSAKELWINKRINELLPVPYFHMVFTIPHEFNLLILYNRKLFYKLLFQSSQKSVKDLMEKKYKAVPGIISLLHTWGSNLSFHVHTHMLVSGGGIHLTKDRWVFTKENYSLSTKALSAKYRWLFIKGLRKLYKNGKLKLPPELEGAFAFENLLDKTFKCDWVVYAKKPFSAPVHVIRYLGNYTHRIAFSNYRIKKVENGRVFFEYKDYKNKKYEVKLMSLEIVEFLRRYLMHVVPKGFVKIRFFGFMAHKSRRENIIKARELISKNSKFKKVEIENLDKIISEYKETHQLKAKDCEICKKGKMILVNDENYFLPIMNSA